MKTIKIELKPLEPYFFGDDRSLKYTGLNEKSQLYAASYFSKSEETPLQSTLFGVLRYLGITTKNNDFRLTNEDISNIGAESFQLGKDNHSFGKIRRISNLFLQDEGGELLIRVPSDHRRLIEDEAEKDMYYVGAEILGTERVVTNQGSKLLPNIKAKTGLYDGYVNIKDGRLVLLDAIFSRITKTGINVKHKDDGYFKKEYCFMKDYSFVFYADVEDSFPEIKDRFVKMGQGKSLFGVNVKEEESPCKVCDCFAYGKPKDGVKRVILLSDTYVKDVNALNTLVSFAITSVRDYRAFKTVYDAKNQRERYKKESVQLKLLKAGSVFWVEEQNLSEVRELLSDKQAEIAGFNQYIIGGEARE